MSATASDNASVRAPAVRCRTTGDAEVAVMRRVQGKLPANIKGVDVTIDKAPPETEETGPVSIMMFHDLAPRNYVVTVNLKGEAPRYDPASVLTLTRPVVANSLTTFSFLLESLPSLKVAIFSDVAKTKPVLGIKVNATLLLVARQAETRADTANAAVFTYIPPGAYVLTPDFDAVQARRYKPFTVNVTLNTSDPTCDPKVVEIVLVPVCTLTIELARDGTARVDPVTITLVGPTAKTTVLAAATGTVTYDDIAPGDYEIQVATQGAETGFRIGQTVSHQDAALTVTPDTTRRPKVRVPGEHVTTVKIVLAPPYTKIQFVGYFVHVGSYIGTDRPLTEDLAAALTAADDDLTRRCSITVDAIKAAALVAEIDPDPATLKIFMAPEFYFRGAQGAYPFQTVSEVLPKLAPETLKPAYKHWLFVFGSALGYLQLETDTKHTVTNLVINTPMTLPVQCATTSAVANPTTSWTLRYTPPAGVESRLAIAAVSGSISGTTKTLTLTVPAVSFPAASTLRLRDGAYTDVFSTTGAVTVAGPRTVTVTLTCTTAKPIPGWLLQQGGVTARITAVAAAGTNRYTCTVSIPVEATFTSAAKLVEPRETEIFNVALVQKGGPTSPVAPDGKRRLKEALVYKEYISKIDFEKPYGRAWDAPHRIINVHGDQRRPIPTEGAIEVLSKKQNAPGTGTVTEVNTSGIGGGSILTIDGIDFGLEVCLDHSNERLFSYYGQGHAKAGEPKVQVHLIPSCGMSIKNKVAVTDGWVFNVDRDHCAAQKVGTDTDIVPLSVTALGMPTAATMAQHFNLTEALTDPRDASVTFESQNGHIVVYAAGVLPARDVV